MQVEEAAEWQAEIAICVQRFYVPIACASAWAGI
jgi:hypothetical protein